MQPFASAGKPSKLRQPAIHIEQVGLPDSRQLIVACPQPACSACDGPALGPWPLLVQLLTADLAGRVSEPCCLDTAARSRLQPAASMTADPISSSCALAWPAEILHWGPVGAQGLHELLLRHEAWPHGVDR